MTAHVGPAPGTAAAILQQVKLIELQTRRLVNSLFAGEYRSVFKGQGLEFAEVREYLPGDEVRSIDWNVTARMRRPFVKRYIEERELTVMLVVDLSGSERFGSARRFKAELACELATVVAMSAARNNDRVGTLLFTDRVELVVPPRKGRRHALRVIRDLVAFSPVGVGTDLAGALTYLIHLLKHRTIVFVVSDFQAADYARPLRLLAQRHDVIAVSVEDPLERMLPMRASCDSSIPSPASSSTSTPVLARSVRTTSGARRRIDRRDDSCSDNWRSTRSSWGPREASSSPSSSSSGGERRGPADGRHRRVAR